MPKIWEIAKLHEIYGKQDFPTAYINIREKIHAIPSAGNKYLKIKERSSAVQCNHNHITSFFDSLFLWLAQHLFPEYAHSSRSIWEITECKDQFSSILEVGTSKCFTNLTSCNKLSARKGW